MESRVKLFGHPIHPMLVVFPLGLLAPAAIFDVLYFFTRHVALTTASYYRIAAGLIGGELVYGLRVGVDREANVNAPSSLTEPSRTHSKLPGSE